MSKPSFSNLDGSIENFDAVVAGDDIGNKYFDQDNFYPACGCSNAGGTIENFKATNAGNDIGSKYFDQDNFYPASGIAKGTYLDKTERQRRRSLREEKKRKELENQKIAAESIAKSSQQDAKILDSLKTPTPKKASGMSTTTKVLIGVGAVAVIGIATYFILRKKK